MDDDKYSSLTDKTLNDDEALENYVKIATIEKIEKKSMVWQERNGSWMIIKIANDGVHNCD